MEINIQNIINEVNNLTDSELTEYVSLLKKDYFIKKNDVLLTIKELIQPVLTETSADLSSALSSIFKLNLIDVGNNKLDVILLIKKILNSGIVEAKTIADMTPIIIKEYSSKEEVENLQKQFIELGAKVEII